MELHEVFLKGLIANRPDADTLPSGSLYSATDEKKIYQVTAAAWTLFYEANGGGGGIIWTDRGPTTLVQPPTTGWSWVNQSGAVVTEPTSYESNQLSLASGTGTGLSIRIRTAPSPPYTITAALHHNGRSIVNFLRAGLCFRENATGELAIIVLRGEQGQIASAKYNSATSFNSDYTSVTAGTIYGSRTIWLRIADNNVNRVVSYSWDAINFHQLHSVGRTDFLTADEVGWHIQTEAAAAFDVNLISWEVT